MDAASKIKTMKEEIQSLDDEQTKMERHINELKGLVEEKKKKQIKIEALKKAEAAELLAEL